MKYWEEFQTKWGFSDGEASPPDAQACRTVYVREINKLAKKYLGQDRYPYRSPDEQRVIIRIEPDKILGMN